MKNILLYIFFIGSSLTLSAQISDFDKLLFDLPDVVFEKINTPKGYESAYKLLIKQPIDHNNPDHGYFYQKAYLSHKGMDKTTVMITQGYNRGRNAIGELAALLQANQIDIEHRYYGESLPDSIEYKYLNLEQATADLHHINTLFRNIYKNKWVATGISKGGQTSIFYRYFYPEDVDVSVPYVAPLNIEREETRIYDFLDTIGSENCRNKIHDVQIRILENRDATLDKLKWYSKGANLKYSYLDFDEAIEYAVLEYPFSFWQWGGKCDEIPTDTASLNETLMHFIDVSGISFFADNSMEAYKSHYYQAGTQMGYYSYNTEGFEKLLKALPLKPNPSAVFMPNKIEAEFNNELPKKVDRWIKEKGDKFIYINGANDTWSATAVQPNEKRDALWFFLEGKDHGQARIKNMTEVERSQLITTLEKWLGHNIDDIFDKEKK
jgi:hypothetical protein